MIVQLALYAAVLGLSLLRLRARPTRVLDPARRRHRVGRSSPSSLLAVVMFSDPAYQAFLQIRDQRDGDPRPEPPSSPAAPIAGRPHAPALRSARPPPASRAAARTRPDTGLRLSPPSISASSGAANCAS